MLGRLALLCGGLFLGVLTLEILLQTAAWWNVLGRRDVPVRDRCPGWTCRELFPDQHPTPEGHALVARTMADSFAPAPRMLSPP